MGVRSPGGPPFQGGVPRSLSAERFTVPFIRHRRGMTYAPRPLGLSGPAATWRSLGAGRGERPPRAPKPSDPRRRAVGGAPRGAQTALRPAPHHPTPTARIYSPSSSADVAFKYRWESEQTVAVAVDRRPPRCEKLQDQASAVQARGSQSRKTH